VLFRAVNLAILLCSSLGWAAFSPLPPAPPPIPVSPVIIVSTNPATFSLTWLAFDPVPEAVKYRIYVVPIARLWSVNSATNFYTTETVLKVPHLFYGQTYWIQAQTWTTTTNSDLSVPFVWPEPLTNYGYFRLSQSSNMTSWQDFGSQIVVTNPLGFYRISGVISNNIDPYQVRE
jgi:hypothetical protein